MAFFDSLRRFFGAAQSGETEPDAAADGITCEEALRLVHDFIDGELGDVPCAEVEAHFEVCKLCYPHLRLERSFREALQRACTCEKASPELRARVLHIASGDGPDA